jgi:hypothetical protein
VSHTRKQTGQLQITELVCYNHRKLFSSIRFLWNSRKFYSENIKKVITVLHLNEAQLLFNSLCSHTKWTHGASAQTCSSNWIHGASAQTCSSNWIHGASAQTRSSNWIHGASAQTRSSNWIHGASAQTPSLDQFIVSAGCILMKCACHQILPQNVCHRTGVPLCQILITYQNEDAFNIMHPLVCVRWSFVCLFLSFFT